MPKTIKSLWFVIVLYLIIYQVTLAVTGVVRLFFFYSESCDSCQEIKTAVLPMLQEKYDRNLDIKALEISSLPNFELLLKLERQADRSIAKTPPLILIGQDILEGGTAIRESLDDLIEKYQELGGTDLPDKNLSDVARVKPLVSEEFGSSAWPP